MSQYFIGKEIADIQRNLRLVIERLGSLEKSLQETRDCLEKLATKQNLEWSNDKKEWVGDEK